MRVEYIELDEAALADMTDVSDADIEQAYESRRAEFRTAEEREAAHILLTLPADADSAQVERGAGADGAGVRAGAVCDGIGW